MTISYRVYPGEQQVHVLAAGKEINHLGSGSNRPPEESGQVPVAEMMVEKAKELPNFNTNAVQAWGDWKHNGLSYHWNEAHEDYAETRTDHHPTELFTHRPPQITYAMSDPAMRHTIPTMVGLALQHDPAGMASGKIMADASLTAHSSKLSQRAAKRGLGIVADPRNTGMEADDVDNAFPSRTMWPTDVERRYPIKATPEEVTQARQWVRDKVRPPREPKRGTPPPSVPGYVQGSLFSQGDT